MKEYMSIFIDKEYPKFIDKYLTTKTLNRIKHVTQFCGCDYTKLYSPLFIYTRFNHSLVVAHMTWHFTHDKKETIVALLHDVGTPCFAHTIDITLGDAINQESSEKSIIETIKQDRKLLNYLKEDGILLSDIKNDNYHILENKSPKLCTDRLDGVLHTCYIWIHTHTLDQIRNVYNDLVPLKNEEGNMEIGFKTLSVSEEFVSMVYNYAHELQWNKDKYVMKYISELVKKSFEKGLITIDDLYIKKEDEICGIFDRNFSSWKKFREATEITRSATEPNGKFYISLETKKRNVIPLVKTKEGIVRVNNVSTFAQKLYNKIDSEKDTKYAYIETIDEL